MLDKKAFTLTPQQCKAARALLDWMQSDLSENSGVAKTTISKFESGTKITPNKTTLRALYETLTNAGIEFVINEDVGISGVVLHKIPSTS